MAAGEVRFCPLKLAPASECIFVAAPAACIAGQSIGADGVALSEQSIPDMRPVMVEKKTGSTSRSIPSILRDYRSHLRDQREDHSKPARPPAPRGWTLTRSR